jgi:hypothetical protein
MTTIVLFRPVGTVELELIAASCYRAFPPRLPEQPIFYPVTNEAYAAQIARDWNTKESSKRGYVTRFALKSNFLARYDRKQVGGKEHQEYWIPAEDLELMNENIVGPIEVIAEFTEMDRLANEKAV